MSRLPVFLLLAVHYLALPFAANGAERLSLSGPIDVELSDGRSYSGQPVSYRDGIVLLRTQLETGEVEQGFPEDDIARIHFPGAESVIAAKGYLADGEIAEAVRHLDAIWRQRAVFLPLLPPETIELLAALPAGHMDLGDPYRAIARAQRLLAHATDTSVRNRLHEGVLLAHYRLEFYDDAEKLALQWLQEQPPFPSSALGWKIVAELALRKEDYERAAWIALQPIATAGPEPVEHLNDCYALAIHAFHQQEKRERAALLYDEMTERNLPWPPNEVLAKTAEIYRAKTVEEKEEPVPEPDLDMRPPEEDLNLPIRDVRKVLRTENP